MERKELDSWLTIDYQLHVTSVKGASLATEEILYGVRGSLVWDESETFSSFNRWSFGERKTKKGFLAMHGFKLNFHRCIGQLDVFHRLIRRRLGVDSSFTSGVCERTTTKCTTSATIRTSRRTVAVERTRKASHIFVSQLSTNQKTNKM